MNGCCESPHLFSKITSPSKQRTLLWDFLNKDSVLSKEEIWLIVSRLKKQQD